VIRDLQVSNDAAGFPVVTWKEDRNFASPEAMKRARVECRIMKSATTGALLFVARGTVRQGSFEEGKPWERLNGFSQPTADQLYYTKKQLELRHHFAGKGVGAKLGASDSAHVLLAEFRDDTALHVNCADASPVDIDRLRVTLTREFVINREELVGDICHGLYQWPVTDEKIMTYDPARPIPGLQGRTKLLLEALGWIVALSIVAALAIAFLLALGVFHK
jgi:hypothetical protein